MIHLFVLLFMCDGGCVPEVWPAPIGGGLIYTTQDDCERGAADMGKMTVQYVGADGKPFDVHGWHYACQKGFYFADYAQTERLTDGRVTCSYLTTMPEAVMARRLDPYEPWHHCSPKPSSKASGKP